MCKSGHTAFLLLAYGHMPTAPHTLTIEQAAAALAAGEITSVALTQACLDHIAAYDAKINAFIRVDAELALEQAAASDARRTAGKTLGPLDGIPYSLKDVYATKDSPTTAASHVLDKWTAPYNATVYTKLSEAGAVLLGKTNTDEFTMGASTENSYYGVTRNPWDTERVAGGSSGGPTAAVAMHFGMYSIGTDTGGSIRQPAAFCGVNGLRATYGRVSRFGELAMASSLDQTGPITKTARDAAIVLQVLAGHDPLDATSSQEAVPNYLAACTDIKGLKIGVPDEYFGQGIDPEVEAKTREAFAQLEAQGAEIIPVSIPSVAHALAVYYIICPAEVSSNMSRYDGIRYGYSIEKEHPEDITDLYSVYAQSRAHGIGAEVKRRIMLGTHVLSSGYYDAYYKKAQAVRNVVTAEFVEIFKQVDVLAAPVSPHIAFTIGSQIDDPLAMYKEDILTVPVNIASLPGMSVPCGFVRDLPVGLQLIASHFREDLLCRVGAAYQQVTDFHLQTPKALQ